MKFDFTQYRCNPKKEMAKLKSQAVALGGSCIEGEERNVARWKFANKLRYCAENQLLNHIGTPSSSSEEYFSDSSDNASEKEEGKVLSPSFKRKLPEGAIKNECISPTL
jgi:hypothetical protein